MPGGSYERYGLTGNPFRELASESVEDVTIFHVNQSVDTLLRTIFDEVTDRENRAVVAVTGPQGAGKTERLLMAAAHAKEHHLFSVYFDVTTQSLAVLRGLAGAFETSTRGAGLMKLLGGPTWLRPLTALSRTKNGAYDPKEAGRRIGAALNATAPSFLLLNDLHNLADSREVELFARTLEELTGVIKPGVLLMFSCYASYLAWLTVNQPGFVSRVNRTLPLVGFSDDEARLLMAKKLLAKRIVEDLEPTYPFDRTAVHALNEGARGNPRRLFELADGVLERAVAIRAYQIDEELVQASLALRDVTPPGTPPAWQGTPAADLSASKEPSESEERAAAAAPTRRSFWGRNR